MQPRTKVPTPAKDLDYKFSLIQGILIVTTWLAFSSAGSETTASGTFLGFSGIFLSFIAFAFAPVSLIVFLTYTIKRQSYKKVNGYFIVSIICQILNLTYLILASKSVAMMLSWNS